MLTPALYNLMLIGVSGVISAMSIVLWWYMRREIVTHQECLRHVQKDIEAQRRELGEWELQSTRTHGELSGRVGLLEGKVDTAVDMIRDMSADIKKLAPTVAILEEVYRKNGGTRH